MLLVELSETETTALDPVERCGLHLGKSLTLPPRSARSTRLRCRWKEGTREAAERSERQDVLDEIWQCCDKMGQDAGLDGQGGR